MATLDKWLHLLGGYPKTIIFPQMSLDGCNDWAGPLLVGSGELRLPDPSKFEYTLRGCPPNLANMMRWTRRAQENPYQTTAQFRLMGTDTSGIDWNLGWTRPEFQTIEGEEWLLTGQVDSMMKGEDVQDGDAISSVENIFEIPRSTAMGQVLARVLGTPQSQDNPGRRERVLDVLGTQIRFCYDPNSRQLAVSAPTSSAFFHPYAENALAQPLRIMFGQLVFPRLIARNFGQGRAMISLRRTPGFIRNESFAALLASSMPSIDGEAENFWKLYTQILSYVVEERGSDDSPNFESNSVTRFHEELNQATRGTRWVWALTLASVVEGQTKMLVQPKERRDDVDEAAIASLCKHIAEWHGDKQLSARATQAVKQATDLTTTRVLIRLRDAGIVTVAQFASWKALRNAVMHGSLISPWSTEEEDQKIMDLAELVRALTLQIVAPCKYPSAPVAAT
jgi:hypothetical protein